MDITPFTASSAVWIRVKQNIVPDSYFCFRKEFMAEEGEAELYLSADSDFILYPNGQEVGRGQFPDYRYDKTWTRFPLSLQKGENLLAV